MGSPGFSLVLGWELTPFFFEPYVQQPWSADLLVVWALSSVIFSHTPPSPPKKMPCATGTPNPCSGFTRRFLLQRLRLFPFLPNKQNPSRRLGASRGSQIRSGHGSNGSRGPGAAIQTNPNQSKPIQTNPNQSKPIQTNPKSYGCGCENRCGWSHFGWDW